MNKSELVDAISDRTGVSKADADAALSAALEIIGEEVAKDNKVSITGWLTASMSHRSARTGRNPQTGEPIQIAASKGVKLAAGKKLKDMVN